MALFGKTSFKKSLSSVQLELEQQTHRQNLRTADRGTCDYDKGRIVRKGALKILALPKFALPAPQFWHHGGFDDKKCAKANVIFQTEKHLPH